MFTLELYGIYKRSSVLLNCIILRNKEKLQMKEIIHFIQLFYIDRYTLFVWCYSNPDK